MHEIDPVTLAQGHGVVTVAQLRRLGWSKEGIATVVATGALVRLRRGWLAHPGAHPRVVEAVVAGGCLSCAGALRLHGAWVPERLAVARHVRRSRTLAGAGSAGCSPYGRAPGVARPVDDVELAFRCVLRCATAEEVVVLADSLVHLRLATREELASWSRDAPLTVQALLERVDAAESGLESIVRLRLRARRIRVRTQVRIGRHRVDIVVGERLVIECDGAEHHADWRAQAADRERDRELTAAGYLVVRLTSAQIVHGWDAVQEDLLAIIRRGDHRTPRRTRTWGRSRVRGADEAAVGCRFGGVPSALGAQPPGVTAPIS